MLHAKALTDNAARPTDSGDRSILSNIKLLEGLDRPALSTLEQVCRYRRFGAGEHIIDRDSTTSDVFFVARGQVRIVSYSVSGREIVFDELDQGDYFGELAALDGLPRSTSVVSIGDSLILALPAKSFRTLLAEHPPVAFRVMERLSTILRAADERIMDLSTLAAQNRVCAELLRQARSRMIDRKVARIDPIPIHGDIASRVSTTRETVARVLNDLARQGLVERTRSALIIRDVTRLREMVDEVRG